MTKEKLLPLETLRKKLADRKLSVVAKRSGLSHPTVKKVARGDADISLRTLRCLSDYFEVYG